MSSPREEDQEKEGWRPPAMAKEVKSSESDDEAKLAIAILFDTRSSGRWWRGSRMSTDDGGGRRVDYLVRSREGQLGSVCRADQPAQEGRPGAGRKG